MKTARIVMAACMIAVFMGSLAVQAQQTKEITKPAPVAQELKAPVNTTITGTVKCEKDAAGVLKSVSIDDNGTIIKVAAKDEKKVAAFDGQMVKATGIVRDGTMLVVKVEAAK